MSARLEESIMTYENGTWPIERESLREFNNRDNWWHYQNGHDKEHMVDSR